MVVGNLIGLLKCEAKGLSNRLLRLIWVRSADQLDCCYLLLTHPFKHFIQFRSVKLDKNIVFPYVFFVFGSIYLFFTRHQEGF